MHPPYYILFSHSHVSATNIGPTSTSLGHPIIQYHYADDSPISLLPSIPDEHVLVIDHDPQATPNSHPIVQSLSTNILVTSLKIAEAPGAAATAEADDLRKNERMYILETSTCDQSTEVPQHRNPQAGLAQFKQRNAIIRRALAYPETTKGKDQFPS